MATEVNISINESVLKDLVMDHLMSKLGDIAFDKNDVKILVKSKQNYQSEWENADFKAEISVKYE